MIKAHGLQRHSEAAVCVTADSSQPEPLREIKTYKWSAGGEARSAGLGLSAGG